MAENYDFLRTFTIDGKKTNHLFQIAKVTIPFLNKENEFYNVGNTDGSHFRGTKLGNYTLQIDGFVIKDNTKMSVSDAMDELKRLCNTDEPKPLVFDVFPDRYFNAIFSGAQEYDATNLDYTPLSLVFEVPDGLAHQINPSGFSNVYTNGTNLMLDSEFNNTKKYMASWVQVLDEKFEGSNIVRADFSNGTPLDEEERNDHWLYKTWVSNRTLPTLKKGVSVGISVYVRINKIDPNNKYAGSLVLEEFTDGKKNGTNHFVRFDNVVNDEFIKYSGTFTLTNEKTNGIAMSLGIYGASASIDYSKPMIGLLPPIGTTVVDSIVGATLYSNSLDFGDYDYSGNANLMNNLSFSDFAVQAGGGTISDGGKYLKINKTSGSNLFVMAGYKNSSYYLTPVLSNTTYTITYTIRKSSNFVPQSGKRIVARYRLNQNVTTNNLGELVLDSTSLTEEFTTYTKTFTTGALVNPNSYYFQVLVEEGLSGEIELSYEIKLERGSTATPYQPNLLTEPYSISRVELGNNIAQNTNLPVTTSNQLITEQKLSSYLVKGETYTVTLEGTKPATQDFSVFVADVGNTKFGDMTPVEGLSDQWQLTFTYNKDTQNSGSKLLRIYQRYPQLGSCTINWVKIEKGNTRTPNINYYKYRGLHSYPSNNPKEYAWEYDPSYFNSFNYAASEEGYADVVNVVNNGTYKAYPTFNFTMNGENGLVAVLNDKGNVLQFGNPEDVDGTVAKRMEMGVNQTFWGNTLPTGIVVNTNFDSVYKNMNSNPATPNLVQGSFSMTLDPDAITPVFQGVGDIGMWHGPTFLLPITAPSTNDRTQNFATHIRFGFENYDKEQRGRIEYAINDENGSNAMTFIVRDSSRTANEIVLEMWYKHKRLNMVSLDRRQFKNSFFEASMERRGSQLIWRLAQIKSLNKYDNVVIDKQYRFVWNLEENDTTKFTTVGAWMMRYSNTYHVLMKVTDLKCKWYDTPYYTDIKNYFQDGDLVTIDVASRALLINGVENTELNIVGNQWEAFRVELGSSTFQPIVSSWANKPDINVELRQTYL